MASRSRVLKPGFFTNELLAELPYEGRLLFAGLWTLADREGRLEDRPKRIKAAVFPFDEVDVTRLLDALEARGFIERYTVGVMPLIQIAKFLEHQTPHARETASTLPVKPSLGDAQAQPRTPSSVSVLVSGSVSDKCSQPDGYEPPMLTFPTAGKPDSWPLMRAQVQEWQDLFESVDVAAECRKALAWVMANKGRKKTAGGMPKFLVGWFGRANDRRGGVDRRQTERREYEPWTCPHTPRCDHRAACAIVSLRKKPA